MLKLKLKIGEIKNMPFKNDMLFWRKKEFVSFLLSILVFLFILILHPKLSVTV